MEVGNYCQSCSMPIDDMQVRGTEKDGSTSKDYCKYCYINGAFTNPDLTLEEMIKRLTKLSEYNKLPTDIMEAAVSRMPHLKRWEKEVSNR